MAWGDIKARKNTDTYNGFCIVPSSTYFPGDREQWLVSVAIYREGKEEVERVFTAKGEYAPTEQDAIRRSLEYGRRIIDGAVPGASVTDL